MKLATARSSLVIGIVIYLLVSSYLTLITVAFFSIALAQMLELTSIKESIASRIHYLSIILVTTVVVGFTSERLWQRYAQSQNRRTQKIVFFLIALALAAFWHYRFFSSNL